MNTSIMFLSLTIENSLWNTGISNKFFKFTHIMYIHKTIQVLTASKVNVKGGVIN